jgi:hypothetical protein
MEQEYENLKLKKQIKQQNIFKIQQDLLNLQQEIEELKIKNQRIKDKLKEKKLEFNKKKIKKNNLDFFNSKKNLKENMDKKNQPRNKKSKIQELILKNKSTVLSEKDQIKDGNKIAKLLEICKKLGLEVPNGKYTSATLAKYIFSSKYDQFNEKHKSGLSINEILKFQEEDVDEAEEKKHLLKICKILDIKIVNPEKLDKNDILKIILN